METDALVGLILTTNLGFRSIADFIACYVETKPPQGQKFADDLTELMFEARRLQALRNSLLHNSWHPNETHGQLLTVLRFRGKIHVRDEYGRRTNAISS